MPLSKITHSTHEPVIAASYVAKQGLSVLRRDVTIAIYPLFVFLLLLLTIPIVNGLILAIANTLSSESVFAAEQHAAKAIFVFIAVVVTAVYTATMLSYFSCILSALTLSELDGHRAPLLKGISVFRKRFGHATKFAFFSILFIPIGIIAQRHKFKHFPIGTGRVIGSAFSLSTAQLAPLILSEDKGIFETVRMSTETLGRSWREGIVIKIIIYITVIILTILIGFFPVLIQSYISDSSTAQTIGRLGSLVLILGLLIATKVLGTIFTTTLYWRIVTNQGHEGKLIK
jgi:hypothetical protein